MADSQQYEKSTASDIDHVESPPPLKLDSHGLPLVPQPSDDPDDPLNWPYWHKVYIVGLIAVLGLVSQMGSALINPAFVQMAKDLNVTVEQASYCTTVFILFGGVAPIFIVPFANVYGRRPCYVIFIIIAAAGQFASAGAPSYGGVIAGRVFNGIGASIPLGIGAATICDLFTQGERGLFVSCPVPFKARIWPGQGTPESLFVLPQEKRNNSLRSKHLLSPPSNYPGTY